MIRLIATVMAYLTHVETRLRSDESRDERGSVTVEHVLWAVAVIAIVGLVVAALRAYVITQSGNIK